ncbi:tyrosine-type recombinase/integrase [Rhodoblastus sp.]|uniref:tyrosine-type recombinase/integrase n=1 Tax=Rhodoblastus sp. TaxID=1962975 RepID=UPI003FD84738
MPNLTDLTIRTLPVGLHLDTRLTSFGIRVGKNRKTWIVIRGTNRTKVSLGHYPAISLADARKRALAALAATETDQIAPPTFPVALKEFEEKHAAHLRPRSAYQLKRNLTRHFAWTKPVDQIMHHDVAEALDAIKAPSQRAHALKDISTFFNWCIPRYLKSSPCVGIKKPPQKSRDRVLSDEELAKVWNRAKEIGHPYGTIVQLLILTGQRAGEIAALRWEWIGDDEDTVTIPAAITKNGRATRIPIGKMARQIVAGVDRVGTLLFPARGYTDKPFRGFGTSKLSLDKCGVKGFTHHDIRRTFATNMAKLGVRLEVTEKLLNHVSGSLGGIVGVYQRHDFKDEMREAVTKWEAHLLTLL